MQVELGTPDSSTPDQGQVQVSVECSSCASPEFKVWGWTLQPAASIVASKGWCSLKLWPGAPGSQLQDPWSQHMVQCSGKLSCTSSCTFSTQLQVGQRGHLLALVDREDVFCCGLESWAAQAL